MGAALLSLAVVSAGCSVELGGNGPAPTQDGHPVPADLGGGSGAGEMPTEQDLDASVGDSVGDAAQSSTSDPGQCVVEGAYALRVAFHVSWVGTDLLSIVPIIDAGEGELSFVVLVNQEAGGLQTHFEASVCDVSVPDFISTLPQERYATRFDPAIWDSPSMPRFDGTVRYACREPGCAFSIGPVYALIGAELPDPAGPWPERAVQGSWPDHDGDGLDGVSVQMLGPDAGSYAYPPLDLVGLRRATELMLGLRAILALEGQLDSCDELSGSTADSSIDTRALGCFPAAGRPLRCTPDELTFVDDNLPIWTVESGQFHIQRLSPEADCEAARLSFETNAP